MTVLLVRDVMTIGVPVCREREACGAVAARLAATPPGVDALVALDDYGVACGWLTRAALLAQVAQDPARPVGELMDEDIPTVLPDIPAEAAALLMRDRGVEHAFLMHDWPGEARPSAVISRSAIARRLALAGEQSKQARD